MTDRKKRLWQAGILVPLFFLASFLIFAPIKKCEAYSPSKVIDEAIFYNKYSMTEADIQSFLESRNSYLKNFIVPHERYAEWNGVNYYEGTMIGPVGHEVNAEGWRASKVIYMASQWYGINPKVIITTLQKESSLVTNPNPPYYGLVQWAMGYSYTESGIRPTCRTDTNNNPSGSCAGFAMQIDWAAGGLKSWSVWANNRSANALQYYTGNTINIDGTPVFLSNGATAALYRYTPHMQTSFVNIYSAWFGSLDRESPYVVASAAAPNDLYLIDSNTKWHVSYAQWVGWGLNKYQREIIPTTNFNEYPSGGELTNLANDGSGKIYLIDNGQRRWIPNGNTFDLWGFSLSNVKTISLGTLWYISNGEDLAYLAKTYSSSNIYFIEGGTKRRINSVNTLDYWLHLPDAHISYVSDTLLGSYSAGTDITGFFIKGTGPNVYAMMRGLKLYVSADINKAWGSPSVVTVSDLTVNAIKTGINLTCVVKYDGLSSVYFLEDGQKRKFLDASTLNNWGFGSNSIIYLTKTTLDGLTEGFVLTRLMRDPSNSKVYWVEKSKKRWIASENAMDRYGYPSSQIFNGSLSNLSILAEGTIIPDTANPTSVFVNQKTYFVVDSVKYWVQDASTFTNWGFNWGDIVYPYSYTGMNSLPEGDTISSFPKDSVNNKIYRVEGGTKKWIESKDAMNLYGYPWGEVKSLSPSVLGIINNGTSIISPSLVVDGKNVYYISNGQKRWIPDASTFTNWGFSWSDVVTPYNVSGIRNYPGGNWLTRFVQKGKDLYLVQSNILRKIDNMDTFNIYNFNLLNLVTVDDALFNSKAQGTALSFPSLATYSNGGKTYFFENGKKRWIKDGDTFTNWGFSWNNVFKTQNNTYLLSYPEGSPLTRLIRDPTNNKVYLVEGGTKRWITSTTVFNAHGYKWSDVYDVTGTTLILLSNGADVSS